jgi:hypothetical protein
MQSGAQAETRKKHAKSRDRVAVSAAAIRPER